MLILLDCCAAATSSAENGNGVTEVIAACGFETSAPCVFKHSFTKTLIEELKKWISRSTLSAAELHNKILSSMKHWKPGTDEPGYRERRKTPVYSLLTNAGRSRSIMVNSFEVRPPSIRHDCDASDQLDLSTPTSEDIEMTDGGDINSS